MSEVTLSLSKEQAALLMPLLPALQQSVVETSNQSVDSYSIADMFSKKKKNSKSTPAQSYLLVSQKLSVYSIVYSNA